MTIMPPPQYDFPPSVPVIEYVLPWPQVVNQKCAYEVAKRDVGGKWQVPWNFRYDGCTFLGPQGCLIIRIDNQDVARHERAHCNGWPWDHPK